MRKYPLPSRIPLHRRHSGAQRSSRCVLPIGTQENHKKFKSPYDTFSADVLDALPASAGMLGGAVGMYLGGPVSAFCIGTLMTGVIGYRVEQYKLGIERKEARDISDEKRANT